MLEFPDRGRILPKFPDGGKKVPKASTAFYRINTLRTRQAQKGVKFKNIEPEPKITGSYKKKKSVQVVGKRLNF